MKRFDGRGRKVAVPLLALSASGWIVYIIAFGWLNKNYSEGPPLFEILDPVDDDHRLHERWFQFWGFAIGGPVFYVLIFLHLLTGQWYIGLFSNFCATFYLVAGGGVLFYNGNLIDALDGITEFKEGRFIITEFAGCLVGVVFVGAYMMVLPFFTNVNDYRCLGYYERAPTPPASAFLFTSPPNQLQTSPPTQPLDNVNTNEQEKTPLSFAPLEAGDQPDSSHPVSEDIDTKPVDIGTEL